MKPPIIKQFYFLITFKELGKGVVEGGEGSTEELNEISAFAYNDVSPIIEKTSNLTFFDRVQNLKSDDDDQFASKIDYEMDEYLEYSSKTEASSCKCLPSCASIYYDAEISQTILDLVKYNRKKYPFDGEE